MSERYTPWGNWHPVSWDEVDQEMLKRLEASEADLAEAVQLAKDAQARAEAAISQLEAEQK